MQPGKQDRVVDINERRQERSVQQVRVIQRVGVLVGGTWIWTDHELAPVAPTTVAPAAAAPQPTRPAPQPSKPADRGPPPPMTMGRDPGKFVLTFGKFFKENGNRPIAIEKLDKYDLDSWWNSCKDMENPSAGLELALEMVNAFLELSTRPMHKLRH